MSTRRPIALLFASNLLGGIGVASGVAVGGLLAEDLGGTAYAGLGQASSVLGAALAAIPLAVQARTHGRRWALACGYLIATLGAGGVVLASVVRSLPLLLVSLMLFGVSTATGLQSRYAAAEYDAGPRQARTISLVLWATTIGAVAGPNLTAPGSELGLTLGLSRLAGPYLFSVLAFGIGMTIIAWWFPAAPATKQQPAVAAMSALRWSMTSTARWAVLLIATAHAVMVMVMVMTPIYMQHHGMSLTLVGIVISVHVLGMYALSPVFGALADRFGHLATATIGVGLLLLATLLGLVAVGRSSGLTAAALCVLGLGWSACVISSSAVLAAVEDPSLRVSLQGATDAGMNVAGAAAAALAGPILAWGGFTAVNLVAMALLVPATMVMVSVGRQHRSAVPALR
ncbi:MAG: MFS transporter [Beutenbergiaceae bacterium]